MVDDNDDPGAFGARIGRRLADQKASAAQPGVAIKLLAEAIIGQFAGVKLPQVTADPEVKEWLAARGLGDGQLRAALTEARRAARIKSAVSVVARPRRQRASSPDRSAAKPRSASQQDVGIVPNLPLLDL